MDGDISFSRLQLSVFDKIKGYIRPQAARTIPRTPETEDMYRLRDELGNTGIPLEGANIIAREIFKLQGRVYVVEAALTTLVALPARVEKLEARKK